MPTVRVDDWRPGVRRLTMDRPPANAIDATLLTDLATALDEADSDSSVRAVVLTGEGRFFSGGLDLSEPLREPGTLAGRLDLYKKSHLRLLTFPKPTVAMVQGHAIAGGLIIALACDVRLGADDDYRIGLNEVAIGASFPKVAFEIARLRLTHAQASEVILEAAIYPATQALRLGVIDELIPPDDLEAAVLSRAEQLGEYPRDAYAHAKAALVSEAAARVEAETAEQSMRSAAVWMMPESVAARKAQRRKLGKED